MNNETHSMDMNRPQSARAWYHLVKKLVRYNFKIIFSDNLKYFIAGAFVIYIALSWITLFGLGFSPTEPVFYWNLLIPGVLIIFYPITFGIQQDADSRILEILFGIPNYRYKVHLLRFVLLIGLSGVVLFLFILLTHFGITPVRITRLFVHLMIPVFCIGGIAFALSTIIKDGSGTAVVLIIIGMLFWFTRDFFRDHPRWDLFLNPFAIPRGFNELVWSNVVTTNRLLLLGVGIAALLYGLLNLQQREKLL